MAHGKEIEIFLVNGVTDSLTTAEVANWNGKAIKIPRNEIENTKRDDLENVGVYMLFCRNDDKPEDLPSVYIGEAENIRKRLIQHLRDYQCGSEEYYWSTAIAFIGRDLNKAHIRYLENRLVDICKACGRYKCLTKNTYKDTVLKESQKASMEEFLENVLILIGVLGYPMPAPRDDFSDPENITYLKCTGNGANAVGFVSAGGFTVLKGSTVSDHLAKSLSGNNKMKRENLESSGIIVNRIFEYDYEFGSPSGASSIILGRPSSGNDDWKTEDGISLKELLLKGLSSE